MHNLSSFVSYILLFKWIEEKMECNSDIIWKVVNQGLLCWELELEISWSSLEC